MRKFPRTRHKGRIGIIVPSSNTNLEPDCHLLSTSEVSLHFTRIGGYDLDAIPDKEEMKAYNESALEPALDLLMEASSDIIAYGCTSATAPFGAAFDKAYAKSMATYTNTDCVTTAGSILEALKKLGVHKLAFTSPYVEEINRDMIVFLESQGHKVISCAHSPKEYTNRDFLDIKPETVYEQSIKADRPEAEALVVSCTDFRAVEVLEALEQDLGKPVVSSNQALMYACLTRLGIDTRDIKAGGRLFQL